MIKIKILIKENCFGGYVGFLADDNDYPIELPSPFNVSATKYTGHDKDKIISLCKRDAEEIFNKKIIKVKDMTK